jgi:GT2 family glycosyltransferase
MDNSIIIPTLDNVGGLRDCIHSVAGTTDLGRTEVIVGANGSPPGVLDYLRALPPPFRHVWHPEPLGFARAVNAGAVVARGERILLLNDDVVILDWGGGDGWVRMLEGPIIDEDDVVATGAARDWWARDKPFLVFFCTMIDRARFLELGMLDEAFGVGAGEDADFCLKAAGRGWRNLQVPVEFDRWESMFPTWHRGHVTCGGIDGFDEVAAENGRILEERYPRTEEDREFQKEFSKGSLNRGEWD